MNDRNNGSTSFRRLWSSLAIDSAVALGVAGRIWQFMAGPVTVVLIAWFFTKEVQGYFYTFASLLALQTFFDLGLTSVLITVASHEWGVIQSESGEQRQIAELRLAMLVRGSRRWFGMCSLAFFLVTCVVGFLFFANQQASPVQWQYPWLCVVLLTSVSLSLSPSIAVLEGCNYVVAVNLLRTTQAVLGNIAVWTAISLGWGLWASVASAGVRLACEAWLVGVRFAPFFGGLQQNGGSLGTFSWSTDVLPLQWRLALQSLANFFAIQIFTPVVFHYQGPIQAGRMGMTWTIVMSLQMTALCWVQPRMPSFGALIAKRRFDELLATHRHVTRVSTGVYLLGGSCFLGALAALKLIYPRLAERMLDLPSAAILTLAFLSAHQVYCLAVFVRAHKVDPFVWIGLGTSSLSALAIWFFGAKLGAVGAVSAHAAVTTFVSLPLHYCIARQMRREDQRQAALDHGDAEIFPS